jgi:hypothetical protein
VPSRDTGQTTSDAADARALRVDRAPGWAGTTALVTALTLTALVVLVRGPGDNVGVGMKVRQGPTRPAADDGAARNSVRPVGDPV